MTRDIPSRADRGFDSLLAGRVVSIDDGCIFCGKAIFRNGEPVGDVLFVDDGVCHEQCRPGGPDRGAPQICVVMSSYTIGDTLSITPVIRELKRVYPDHHLDIMTIFPELFKYNSRIRRILRYDKSISTSMLRTYDHVLQPFQPLNPAFPQHFNCHLVQFASYGAMKKMIDVRDWSYEAPYTKREQQLMAAVVSRENIDLDRDCWILLHPHRSGWPTRDWPMANWAALISRLKREHPQYKLVSIGGSRDGYLGHQMSNFMEQEGVVELYNKLTLLETVALADHPNSRMLITMDTAPVHLAGCAAELPILGIFTVVRSKYRLPVRHGIIGYRARGIDVSDCSCTYDYRWLTDEIELAECGKMRSLDSVMNTLLGKKGAAAYSAGHIRGVLDGYSRSLNREPHWDYGILARLIKQVAEELQRYQQLPCHPEPDQVYDVFERFLEETERPGWDRTITPGA